MKEKKNSHFIIVKTEYVKVVGERSVDNIFNRHRDLPVIISKRGQY